MTEQVQGVICIHTWAHGSKSWTLNYSKANIPNPHSVLGFSLPITTDSYVFHPLNIQNLNMHQAKIYFSAHISPPPPCHDGEAFW